MPWFQVRIGYTWSCGGEWDEYMVKARNPEHARAKVLAVHTPELRERDRVEVSPADDQGPPRVFSNGVMYTGRDYWER